SAFSDLLVRPHAPHDQTTRRRQRRCFHRPPDLVRGRLTAGAERVIFLIADRGPVHIARKTRAFVESLNGSPRLFHLPPYSHDRNPGELVWSVLQKHMRGGGMT